MLIHYIHYSFPSGVILYILLSYHSLPNFLDCVSMSFFDSNPHKHTQTSSLRGTIPTTGWFRKNPSNRPTQHPVQHSADLRSLTNKKQNKTAPRDRKIESFPCFFRSMESVVATILKNAARFDRNWCVYIYVSNCIYTYKDVYAQWDLNLYVCMYIYIYTWEFYCMYDTWFYSTIEQCLGCLANEEMWVQASQLELMIMVYHKGFCWQPWM